jgi:hypothetical protein
MAKVTAPLQSFEAHGSVAKSLTFRKDNGRNVVSAYTIPGGFSVAPVSEAQVAQRVAYRRTIDAWHALTSEEKQAYNLRARRLHLSGYNLFLKENLGSLLMWSHRLKITIHGSFVTSDLSDFPVFLRLSDFPAVFWDNVKNGGGDIRITKADGTTEVPREIVSCDTTTQKGEVHFRASGVLFASVDTDFYIYFGNVFASDYAPTDTYGAQAVWSDYFFVSHNGGGTNSTDGASGTITGGITLGAGGDSPTGKATQFDGTNDYIDYADNASQRPTTLTAEMWIKSSRTAWSAILEEVVSKRTSSGRNGYILGWILKDLGLRVYSGDGSWRFIQSNYTPINTWRHITMVRGLNYMNMFLDGGYVGNRITGTAGITYAGTQNPLRIGGRNDVVQDYFSGFLGEIRLSSLTRSPEWLFAEYTNQSSNSFYTIT